MTVVRRVVTPSGKGCTTRSQARSAADASDRREHPGRTDALTERRLGAGKRGTERFATAADAHHACGGHRIQNGRQHARQLACDVITEGAEVTDNECTWMAEQRNATATW